MDTIIRQVEQSYRKTIPSFRPGDTIQVHLRVKEGERERVQIYEGVVTARKGSELSETITVRKRSFGVNVEKILPVHSPTIEEIRVMRRGRVRRAKLYYLREKSGKAARIMQAARAGSRTPAGETATSAEPAAAAETTSSPASSE